MFSFLIFSLSNLQEIKWNYINKNYKNKNFLWRFSKFKTDFYLEKFNKHFFKDKTEFEIIFVGYYLFNFNIKINNLLISKYQKIINFDGP